MYESAIAGAFMYRFGYRDAVNGLGGANLLLNPQNPLDELLGDLIGELRSDKSKESRYFLVEFKRELTGDGGGSFGSELTKEHRLAFFMGLLSQQLNSNSPLEKLVKLDQGLSIGGNLRGTEAPTQQDLFLYLVKLSRRQLQKGRRAVSRAALSKKLEKLKSRLAGTPTIKGQKVVRKDRAKFGQASLRMVQNLTGAVSPASALLGAGKGAFDWLNVLGHPSSHCWQLSLLGHFGVWRSKRMLRAAPYIHAVLAWPGKGWRWGTFRQLWSELRQKPSPVHPSGLWFCDGLGLTADGIMRYLECLFAHRGKSAAHDATEIVLGKVVPGGSAMASIGRFSSLHAAYEAMHGLRNN